MHKQFLSRAIVVLSRLGIAAILLLSAWVLVPELEKYRALRALTAAIRDKDDTANKLFTAVEQAKRLRCVDDAVPSIVGLMSDADEVVRRRATNCLRAMGAQGKAAVPALTKALKEDAAVRSLAAEALGSMGADAKESAPVLAEALKDDDAMVRVMAARSLWLVASDSELTVPALVDCLKDRTQLVRVLAAWSLGQMGRDARAAVPALLRILREDEDGAVRWKVVQALEKLGEMGVEAEEIVCALKEATADDNETVRTAAVSALQNMRFRPGPSGTVKGS